MLLLELVVYAWTATAFGYVAVWLGAPTWAGYSLGAIMFGLMRIDRNLRGVK